MGTSAYDTSLVKHKDLLRMQDRTDSLCNNDNGTVFYLFRQCFSKRSVCF